MLISVNYQILTVNQNPHLLHTPTIHIYDIPCGSCEDVLVKRYQTSYEIRWCPHTAGSLLYLGIIHTETLNEISIYVF